MKKLLLLGGSRYLLPVIKIAKELGVYVITCDYLPNNIAHKYSDEYINVSIIDKEAVLNVAREKGVSGIMSFACDPGVVTAAYVAEKLNLPSCGSYEAVSILQNKARFRKFLEDNGFNVPKAKGYRAYEDALKEINLYKWPIIVKPTDSAGSKGVERVDNLSQLKDSVNRALEYSISKQFIIEEFVEKRGCSSDSDSFSVNGQVKFITFSAQRFDLSSKNPFTPAAYSWPSTFSSENETKLRAEIQRLITLLGLRSSIYNIETRESEDGLPYIMELSPRGGGNRLSEVIRYATGVDLIKNAVLAALGEDINDLEQKDYNGFWAEVILHSSKNGIFKNLKIKTLPGLEIIEKDLWIKEGDFVKDFSGANEAVGTLILKFESGELLEEYMNNLNENVVLTVEENR